MRIYICICLHIHQETAENNYSGNLEHYIIRELCGRFFFLCYSLLHSLTLESCENFTCLKKLYFKEIETYNFIFGFFLEHIVNFKNSIKGTIKRKGALNSALHPISASRVGQGGFGSCSLETRISSWVLWMNILWLLLSCWTYPTELFMEPNRTAVVP